MRQRILTLPLTGKWRPKNSRMLPKIIQFTLTKFEENLDTR